MKRMSEATKALAAAKVAQSKAIVDALIRGSGLFEDAVISGDLPRGMPMDRAYTILGALEKAGFQIVKKRGA